MTIAVVTADGSVRRRGRPQITQGQPRKSITLMISADTRRRVEGEAARTGLSFSQVVDRKLEEAFRVEDLIRLGLADSKLTESRITELPDGRMTREDAAKYLGFRPQTLAAWAVRNQGPKSIRVGGKVFYTIEALEAFVQEQSSGAQLAVRALQDTDYSYLFGRRHAGRAA